jgi:hypothetical protein
MSPNCQLSPGTGQMLIMTRKPSPNTHSFIWMPNNDNISWLILVLTPKYQFGKNINAKHWEGNYLPAGL